MPTISDIINRTYREFHRYTGDGKPNEPTGAPLPIGDPQSGVHSPKKSDLREAFVGIGDVIEAARERAETALGLYLGELPSDPASGFEGAPLAGGEWYVRPDGTQRVYSSVAGWTNAPEGPPGASAVSSDFMSRAAAILANVPAPVNHVRTAGYATAGDGGGALYKRVGSEPLHAGKFQSNDGAWWEIAERAIVPDQVGGVQAAIDVAHALSLMVVLPRIYDVTATVALRPGVRIWGGVAGQGGIRQAAGASFTTLLDWNAHAAHGAKISDATIDGNSPANGTLYPSFLAYIYDANDAAIERCRLLNARGFGVFIRNGRRPIIRDNEFDLAYFQMIYVEPVDIQTRTQALVTGNTFRRIGIHAMSFFKSDANEVRNNRLYGNRIDSVVNIVGLTVTWVSGANFSGLRPGNFLIYGGGVEVFIESIQSDTSLTLSTAPGNQTGIAVAGGCGDHIGFTTGNDNVADGNEITDGASIGITLTKLTSGAGAGGCSRNRFTDNKIFLQGSCGICIIDTGAGDFTANDNVVAGNQINACAQNGARADANFNMGIVVSGSTCIHNFIHGNSISDYSDRMIAGVSVGLNTNRVHVGDNQMRGMAEAGVRNGVGTITLSAGWGSGATVSAVVSHGRKLRFNVTAGSSPSANPTITVPLRALGLESGEPPIIVQRSGTFTFLTAGTQSHSDTQAVFNISGTPNAGSGYFFTRCSDPPTIWRKPCNA